MENDRLTYTIKEVLAASNDALEDMIKHHLLHPDVVIKKKKRLEPHVITTIYDKK
jgi:hypothetical protein